MGNKCYYLIRCIFHVFIFISAALTCVQSLTVCDLTDWAGTEGHFFCLHCLRLNFYVAPLMESYKGNHGTFKKRLR